MTSARTRTVAVDQCVHRIREAPGACRVVEVISPSGAPVSGPTNAQRQRPAFHLGEAVVISLAFAMGWLVAAVSLGR